MKIFKQEEQAYLQWIIEYKNTGLILNVDEPQNIDDYPKLHLASYQCVTSPNRTNYTNNEYFKVCSENRAELEAWSKSEYGKEPTLCGVCFRKERKRN